MYLVNKEKINRSLSPKIVDARVTQIFNSFDNVLLTSSFGTTSAVLLHIVSRIRPNCPIYFIDTGYHFKETLAYKKRLSWQLDLNVVDIHPNQKAHQFTEQNELWEENPDRCCDINKVKPLESVKENYDAWMSGLIAFQNSHRGTLDIVDDGDELIKFYPLIEWNSDRVEEYMEVHSLPQHPLKKHGYHSVGCTHCTATGSGREGRWNDSSKTECGLHR